MAKNRARDKSPDTNDRQPPGPETVTFEPVPESGKGQVLKDLAHAPAAPPAATLVCAGEIAVAPGATVRESLWSKGRLVIGALARTEAAVTADVGAEVGEGARIEGALTVKGTLRWGRGAFAANAAIDGPLVTGNGQVRLESLVAPGGIHAGSATTMAVSR